MSKAAMALGLSVDASTRHGREVANFIRGRKAEEAVKMLEAVIEKKLAVPYRLFKRDLSHKTGVGPARFPVKTSKAILAVLKNAIANAQQKGLNPSDLVLTHISVQMASKPWHSGRKGRTKMKRANIEIVIEPAEPESKEKKKGKKDNVKNRTFKKHKQGGNR
jgi:ribosomal protein uL22